MIHKTQLINFKWLKGITYVFLLTILFSCGSNSKNISYYVDENLKPSVSYGLNAVRNELHKKQFGFEKVSESKDAQVIVNLISSQVKVKNDGYTIVNDAGKLVVSSESERGLLYGLQDVSEQLKKVNSINEVEEKSITAHYPFRAIKFNLPWFSYRSGENLDLHYDTCKDLNFWESFLNMMVENKFNALTLWNMHPYMFMVQSPSFPEASPFSEVEMNEWKIFWKSLFKMAKERGIETYVVNWNIFVSEEFSKAYGMADYSKPSGFWGEGESNEYIEHYTREMVTETINEYDDLTGIGLTLGERMGGMTSEERKDWIDRTIIAGLKNAKREARLIYRAPLSANKDSGGTTSVSTERITREAIENIDLTEDVLIEFKFNWSHAHSSPKVSIVHGGILTDTYWNPKPKNYKGIWTMRNEDFFALRWAQPDFIRSFMNYNSQDYIGGCIIGSETYIPAKDYITKNEFRTWDYAFERQWLFYKVWGNLLYNSETPDSYFASELANKFNLKSGEELLSAWKLASMNANRFASFYQGTWDATIYTEGFTTVGGKLIDIEEFIIHPVLDSTYVNIENFVKGNFKKEQISPLQLADITEKESQEALKIVAKIKEQKISQELEIELNDIEAWSHYGFYFASKLRGGTALQLFKTSKNKEYQQESIKQLELGLSHWETLVELMEKYNVAEMPYQFDSKFSWRKHIPAVKNDIDVAKK